jgi:hypothetical protein
MQACRVGLRLPAYASMTLRGFAWVCVGLLAFAWVCLGFACVCVGLRGFCLRLLVFAFGLSMPLLAARVLTKISKAQPPTKSGLAASAAAGHFDIRALLQYSAVCGIGLDTVPIPGDTTQVGLHGG